MLTIRLQRRGRKHDPSFRLIVTDSKRAPKSGKYLEMVGSYDPRVDRVDLKAERITHWMEHGAQVSDTVHNLLVSQNVVSGKKINVLPKKTVPKAEVEEAPAAPAAAPAGTVESGSTARPEAKVETNESAEATETAVATATEETEPAQAASEESSEDSAA